MNVPLKLLRLLKCQERPSLNTKSNSDKDPTVGAYSAPQTS